MSEVADTNGSSAGLTLKQLVLEIREDIRLLRNTIEAKVDRAEFNLLKDKIERAMSGEATSAYGKAMLDEYVALKASVKQLEKIGETAKTAQEIADKTKTTTDSNRKWIIGLVIGMVSQAAVIIYGIMRGQPLQ